MHSEKANTGLFWGQGGHFLKIVSSPAAIMQANDSPTPLRKAFGATELQYYITMHILTGE
jgi:hypothetical protein